VDLDTTSRSDASDFKLGDWWVRPQRNELERDGETAHVEARSMGVLVCLGRHAPGVVGKERLLEEVWSDSPYVGDDAISHAIWELRKVLGDSAREPVYIQTVPRKGYRLVAEILRPQGSPLPMEGVRIDHYDLGEEIGRGSMGVVYEAVDRRLGRTVAIKFLAPELTRDPEACRRFEREARVAASLDHPNLATVHEIGETSQGHRYLVSACYRGGSLKDRLAQGPIEAAEAKRLVRQLLAGLGAAHQRGVVHRDVKPANLMLDEHGILKICDFGIAKLLGATDLTRTGAPLGTPAYKSPEQARGREVDHRTDLWAAGVVLFELLAGRRPFDGEYELAVVHSILSREPRPLEEARGGPIPEPLRRFVAKALAKDPAERYQSAEEMIAALDDLEDPASHPVRPRSWRRWMTAAAGVLVVLLALLWTSSTRQESTFDPGRIEVPRDHLVQGRNLWLRGNHRANLRQVREHFEKAVELQPSSPEALGHLAAFLAESSALSNDAKDRDRARDLVQKALAIDPRSSLARAAESWILVLEGEFEKGEQLAREARDIERFCDRNESCDLAYLWLGEALWAQERAEEAFAVLEEGTRVGGGHIRCRLKRAQFFERSGAKREAEGEYLEVLQWDEEQTTALEELANFYLTTDRPGDALDYLWRLHRKTEEPRVLVSIGYAQYRHRLWDEAIETYRDAHAAYQAAGDAVPTPLMAIGDIYLERDMREVAQEHFRQALDIFDSLDQPSIFRQAQRAVCLAKLERLEEAENEIRRLLERAEEIPDLLFYAGRIYALKRDTDTLLDLARRWADKGLEPWRFLDDPAFLPYRENREYLRVLEPGLFPAR
jgi:serine/threonine protein kinase